MGHVYSGSPMSKIVLITGCPGSGKSTIARVIAEKLPRCVHLQVDDIRESMVNGMAPPGEWTPDALQQFRLARDVASYWARIYAVEEFNVVIDDVCVPEQFVEHYEALFDERNMYRILLDPSAEALTERITNRGGPYVDFYVEQAIPYVASLIVAMPKEGWIVLDTSDWTIDQTVAQVQTCLT